MKAAADLDWLYSTQLTGIKLGLDNMRRLLEALDLPREPGADGTPRFFHVAGTNGKGSVCAMLDALLRAEERRTGFFSSPHLVRFNERIRVDGVPISEEALARGLSDLRRLTAHWSPLPTFFEFTTALALMHFRGEGVEDIAWETGLGGRLDSTNVVRPAVSVITSIGLDHQQYLGASLEEIAREKAGIIKPGVPVVLGEMPEAAREVVLRRAAELQSRVREVAVEWTGPISLAGAMQRRNAALALAACDEAGLKRPRAEALAQVCWPGRFDRREGGQLVLDGAHNVEAALTLVSTWQETFGTASHPAIVFGAMADKDARGVLAALALIATRFICVTARNPRAAPAAELARLAAEFAPAQPARDLGEALTMARAEGGRVLVCGSLFLVGEAISLLEGENPPRETRQ